MDPWRAYLLSLQDFARWIGIHEEMINSNLHEGLKPMDGDVEAPSLGYDRGD